MSKSKFFGRPTLGGWLSMLNVGLFAAFAGLTRLAPRFLEAIPEEWFVAVVFVMSAPFAWVAMIPSGTCGGGGRDEFIAAWILIGLNSFAWGYGLAAIIRRTSAGIRRLRVCCSPVQSEVDLAAGAGG